MKNEIIIYDNANKLPTHSSRYAQLFFQMVGEWDELDHYWFNEDYAICRDAWCRRISYDVPAFFPLPGEEAEALQWLSSHLPEGSRVKVIEH